MFESKKQEQKLKLINLKGEKNYNETFCCFFVKMLFQQQNKV